jgi:hypothetical protein
MQTMHSDPGTGCCRRASYWRRVVLLGESDKTTQRGEARSLDLAPCGALVMLDYPKPKVKADMRPPQLNEPAEELMRNIFITCLSQA